VIPFDAQETTNRFPELKVANADDYEVGKSYEAQAVDSDGPYDVLATIEAKHGNVITGPLHESLKATIRDRRVPLTSPARHDQRRCPPAPGDYRCGSIHPWPARRAA